MNDEQRRDIALFRYGIIAPIISEITNTTKNRKEFFRNAAKLTYTNPRGEDTKVCAGTIERWFYTYLKGGFDALIPKRRTDTGQPRKMDDDIKQQIIFLKKEYPRIPATLIHQKLIDNGRFTYIGLTDDSNTNPVILFFFLILFREIRSHYFQHIADAQSVGS